METWLSPYAVHLEPSQHCYLVTFQYKIKSSIKKNLKNINRLLDTVGEGEGGVIGENSIETYTIQYAIQIASSNLLYDAGNPKLTLCDNIEGWDGEGGGREVQERGDICIHVASSR